MKNYLEFIDWVLNERLQDRGPMLGLKYARIFDSYTVEKKLEQDRQERLANVNKKEAELTEPEVNEIIAACIKLDKLTKNVATVVVSRVFHHFIKRLKVEDR